MLFCQPSGNVVAMFGKKYSLFRLLRNLSDFSAYRDAWDGA